MNVQKDSLETLIGTCERLNQEESIEEAKKYYENEVFPKVKELVRRQGQKDGLVGHYDNLMLTVGFSPEPLILTITALQPKRIFFLFTEKSEGFIDKVVEGCGLRFSQIERALIERADASDVYEKVKAQWEVWRNRGRVAIDMTGGTKPMVSGCGIAAALLGIDVLYVDSQFGWILGKSKPGTERIVRLSNPFDVFGEFEEKQGIELFNSHNYPVAAALLNRLCSKVSDPRRFEVEYILARGYGAWDSFQYKEAFERLSDVQKRLKRYRIFSSKISQLEKHIDVLKMLKRNGTRSHFELLKDKNFSETLMIDMFWNAERRAYQGRYDDGIVRLYRLLELISQARLAVKYNINTNDAEVSSQRVREDFTRLAEALYGYAKNLPKKIGLMDGWLLLFTMKDKVIGPLHNLPDLKKFMDKLLPRNELMIEHMNHPGKSVKYKEFRRSVLPWIKATVADFDARLKDQRFIDLPL